MKCSACGRPSLLLAYVERTKRAGFGYRTVRSRLCPACAPAPVVPVGVTATTAPPSPGEGAWAVMVGRGEAS